MEAQFHVEMLTQVLSPRVSVPALQAIIRANLGQDSLLGLLHFEYHFDHSDFRGGWAYVEQQRQQGQAALANGQAEPAWAAFGRLSHAVQDYYAHSNYCALWLAGWQAAHPGATQSAPEEIDALDPVIHTSPDLCSGRIYLLELLALIPVFRPLAARLLPADSHYAMNLDHPGRGAMFPYALAAARQRTLHEYKLFIEKTSPAELALFTGLA